MPGQEITGLTSRLERKLPADHPQIVFSDVAREAGIEFRHFAGDRSSQLPEDMGSGAAWGDYDRDGWLDLYVVNQAGPLTATEEETAASPARSTLYRNQGDGTFSDVGDRAGVAESGQGMGAAWGDYDNDGWSDLVVTRYGSSILYHNEGDGSFTEHTRVAGLSTEEGFWTGASWADYDRDGFLDLYITGYVRYDASSRAPSARQYDVDVPANLNPSSFAPERNLLYRNDGDGTFTELADRVGVSGRTGRSLSAAWSDFDADGWLDLYVANDLSDNMLFRNLGDGTFADISHSARVADYRGAMGLALGDWDRDGDQDLFVTHWIAQENALYVNTASRRDEADSTAAPAGSTLGFMDQADRHGLGQIALDYVGWGTSFFDYDNDGWLDLLVVNGSTIQKEGAPHLLVPMFDQVFWNRPDEGFYDVSPVSGEYFSRELVGRGAAVADYDEDGDVDVFIVSNGGPAVLLRNDGGNQAAWLKVHPQNARGGRSPVGVRIRVFAASGEQFREAGTQSSYLSQNSPIEHFGLGSEATVDSLEVVWQNGDRWLGRRLAANQTVRIRQGAEVNYVKAESDDSVSRMSYIGARSGGASEAARDSLRHFWEAYREATRHRAAGDVRQAAQSYARALDLNGSHEDALYYIGNMYLELGELGKAEASWERLIRVNPQSARAFSRLGSLHSCLDATTHFDLDRAEEDFQRARQLNPEEIGPRLRLAAVALMRDSLSEGQDYLEAVLGSDADNLTAHYWLGYIAWTRGDSRGALAFMQAAMRRVNSGDNGTPGPSEGDTRSGRPMLLASARCRTLEAEVENLAPVPQSDLAAETDRRYRRLAGILRETEDRQSRSRNH